MNDSYMRSPMQGNYAESEVDQIKVFIYYIQLLFRVQLKD